MNITGGKFNGRKIIAPDEKITRPTLSKVRMGVFNTLFSILNDFENKSFLDLFGGSGIMGLEAASRGFRPVFVSEKNKIAAEIIIKNYAQLSIRPNLFKGDSLKFLNNITNEYFDVIYIDPPYESGIYEKVFQILKNKVSTDTIIIAEHSSPLIIKDFDKIKEKNYGGKLISFFVLTDKNTK